MNIYLILGVGTGVFISCVKAKKNPKNPQLCKGENDEFGYITMINSYKEKEKEKIATGVKYLNL